MIRGFCFGMIFAAILAYFLHADVLLLNLAQQYVPSVSWTREMYYLSFGIFGILLRLFK